MTEAEWLACDDPAAMLNALRDHGLRAPDGLLLTDLPGDRKLRLFACACWRHGRTLDGDFAAALDRAERHVDGEGAAPWAPGGYSVLFEEVTAAVRSAVEHATFRTEQGQTTRPAQAALLREIVGNPFRPVGADDALPMRGPGKSSWGPTLTALELADVAYEERLPDGTLDPVRLAILADALEDAGADDAAIPAHLRSPGPHVRGCWVLDLVLGKE